MLAFTVIAVSALAQVFNTQRMYLRFRIGGIVLVTIASIAFVGYATGVEFLEFYIPNISTAMSFHTALGFLVIGWFLLNQAKQK